MKYLLKKAKTEIPSGVTVTIKSRIVTVKGPRGTLVKDFRHIKADIIVSPKEVEVHIYNGTYKESAILYTLLSHIRNMIKGVTAGYRFKMHAVKKHFPIGITIKDGAIEISRFMGEINVKVVKLLEGVTCKKNEKDDMEYWFEGNDLDKVALTCAKINQSCTIYDKDRRKFLDGIYVSEKDVLEK